MSSFFFSSSFANMYFGGACNLNEVFGQCQTNYHERHTTHSSFTPLTPLTYTETISIIPIYLLKFDFKIDI